MKECYRVTLAEEERRGLRWMVSAGKAAARKLVRARILLLADQADITSTSTIATPRRGSAIPTTVKPALQTRSTGVCGAIVGAELTDGLSDCVAGGESGRA